jgi:sugar phosphate permease
MIAGSATGKAYRRVVLPLFFVSILAYIDRVNIGYAALAMNSDLGFDAGVFGLGAGIFFVGYLLFEIPGALIAEKFGPRRWLARIMITWGLVSGLMAFMHTAWQFYLIRFLLGAAEASLYPVLYATCIPRFFEARQRARAIAVLLTSLQVSGIIGAPLAGWLIGVRVFGLEGWQALFLLEAIPAVVLGVALLYLLADRPRQAAWLTEEEQDFLTAQYEREREAQMAVRRYTVREALRDREVLRLSAIYFLWITGFWGFNYWMPTMLASLSGWPAAAIGRAVAVAMTISLAVSLYTGHSSSRRNEKRWHVAAHLFLAGAAMAAGAWAASPRVYFALMVPAAIGTYAPMAVWWSYPTTFLSGAAAAGAVGLINSAGNLGGFAGPYLTGWVKQHTGSFAGAMVYLGVSLAAAGFLVLTMGKRQGPPRELIQWPEKEQRGV